MILSLLRKKPADTAIHALYGAIVAEARQPLFYAGWGVPDTVTGRFDMVSLHLALVLRRLRADPPRTADFGQQLFDLFFRDMDRSLREMGAGDLAVPKKIRKMGNLFYGLATSLDAPLAARDRAALATILGRNIYSEAPDADALPLAGYVLDRMARLDAFPLEDILAGRLPEARAHDSP